MEHVKIGSRVEVKRVNAEPRVGYVLERVECLRHIGEFYNVGDLKEERQETPAKRGRPRKGAKRAPKRLKGETWGTYAPEDMQVLEGRPRSIAEVCQ